MGWSRRLLARGVFWRQLLRFALLHTPLWVEPLVMAWWSLLFLLSGPARRGVMENLRAIKPGSLPLVNLFRTYRVFWNFSWSITDTGRFRETRLMPDWEFADLAGFESLVAHDGGAIILTAHMGSYDLGAHVFSSRSDRKIVMVRAPEVDPQTQQYEESQQTRWAGQALSIGFNTKAGQLALELLEAIARGEFVAIQGDRITPGVATLPAKLFGRSTLMPAGPFALALAARVPIFPLFVVRVGRRRYRLITGAPIVVQRKSRHREEDFRTAVEQWSEELECAIRRHWYQWFAFESFSREGAA